MTASGQPAATLDPEHGGAATCLVCRGTGQRNYLAR